MIRQEDFLGRDTVATVAAYDQIKEALLPAPTLFAGPLPDKSPDLRRFLNVRRRAQEIGCCVGESGAASGELAVRTPGRTFDPAAAVPLDAVDLSALWVYNRARKYSAEQGVRMGRAGAIVSHALLAILRDGHRPYASWPSTSATYRAYRDGDAGVPEAARAAETIRVVADVRRIISLEQGLEYLAGGYTLWVGSEWRSSMGPARDGAYGWGGGSPGGHAYHVFAYDKAADTIGVQNSWDNVPWGVQPGGIGFVRLSAWARDFSDRTLSGGASEIVVVSDVGDWLPRVRPWADAF
jgi:hypothetical protein